MVAAIVYTFYFTSEIYGKNIVMPTLIFLSNRQTFIATTDREMFIKHICIWPREGAGHILIC